MKEDNTSTWLPVAIADPEGSLILTVMAVAKVSNTEPPSCPVPQEPAISFSLPQVAEPRRKDVWQGRRSMAGAQGSGSAGNQSVCLQGV